MGAGIGQALGMEKAGVNNKVVAIIGDSTFMHSGITGLVNAVYNDGHITIIILDNRTTAMTGHQEHPGTGISAQGKKTHTVEIENLARGIGVKDVKILDAFDIKALRDGVRDSLDRLEVSVIIVRGACAMRVRKRTNPRQVDREKCTQCGICLRLGCPAIQSTNDDIFIEPALCAGDICGICEQLCPVKAISSPAGAKP
jgi:indolepyruvate ferredoxin oxidoreductase alpha subunit